MDATPFLSARGRRLVETPPLAEYIRVNQERVAECYHPKERPDGYISLCIAENKLMGDLMVERLAACPPVPESALGYDAMIGSATFRSSLATFLERSFIGRPVSPEHLVVLAGAGTVLEVLFYAIADPGDAVLIPTPSYSAFWADLGTRDGLSIVTVDGSSDHAFSLDIDDYERAYQASDRPVRALLFTNPSNPLGRIYPPDEVAALTAWAEAKGLHVVFDEIYALSVHGQVPFVSAAHLAPELGPRRHIVWAFSKDFAASGLRVGVLVSENPDVLAATEGLAYWASTSGHTQALLTDLIDDAAWSNRYVAALRERLARSYRSVTTELASAGIPHVQANAGIFLLLDLHTYLREPSFVAEAELWRHILDQANVNLTPGSACRIAEPGFFRLCFASQSVEVAVEGVRRLAAVLAEIRPPAA